MGPLPGSPARCSRTGGGEGSSAARPNANPAARPPPHPAPARQPWAPGPGRAAEATAGGRRRAVPPPLARPQGPGRCQGDGTCSPRGARPLPRPAHLRCPALAAPRPGERRRSRGAKGGPPTHLRARAATPGGQRHPEPPQPLLPPPPEVPLRKRDHWSEAATLPDMVPPSSPPTSPFPHAGQPSHSDWGTEVRLPRSDARLGSRASIVSSLKCPIRKVGFRELVPFPKTAGPGTSNIGEHLPPPPCLILTDPKTAAARVPAPPDWRRRTPEQ